MSESNSKISKSRKHSKASNESPVSSSGSSDWLDEEHSLSQLLFGRPLHKPSPQVGSFTEHMVRDGESADRLDNVLVEQATEVERLVNQMDTLMQEEPPNDAEQDAIHALIERAEDITNSMLARVTSRSTDSSLKSRDSDFWLSGNARKPGCSYHTLPRRKYEPLMNPRARPMPLSKQQQKNTLAGIQSAIAVASEKVIKASDQVPRLPSDPMQPIYDQIIKGREDEFRGLTFAQMCKKVAQYAKAANEAADLKQKQRKHEQFDKEDNDDDADDFMADTNPFDDEEPM